jgi:hypothetical protein
MVLRSQVEMVSCQTSLSVHQLTKEKINMEEVLRIDADMYSSLLIWLLNTSNLIKLDLNLHLLVD